LRGQLFAGASVARRIEQAIDDKGQIADRASPLLAKIRRNIRDLERDIPNASKKTHPSGADMDDIVQDRIVTVRNGRFVIPVRSDNPGRRQWVLQDRSASGATSFVEPIELSRKQQAHSRTALRKSRNAPYSARADFRARRTYRRNLRVARLSWRTRLLLARGRLSADMKAIAPEISDGDELIIKSGRHPLLTGEAIPIDVTLGGRIKTLILTGPNAGGKTVTLKLIGLFQLMAQSGLHVPAADAKLPVFSDIFAVIGDEQSVEDNLSTFSSHLKEVRWAMERARAGCLVLIDEICAARTGGRHRPRVRHFKGIEWPRAPSRSPPRTTAA